MEQHELNKNKSLYFNKIHVTFKILVSAVTASYKLTLIVSHGTLFSKLNSSRWKEIIQSYQMQTDYFIDQEAQ